VQIAFNQSTLPDDLRRKFTRHGMADRPITLVAPVIAILVAAPGFCGPTRAQATHKCDPVDPISDVGWSVVPSLETVGVVDSAPYQAGTSGDWFIERATTRIPFCNYYNEIGIYSMRSYTLAPQVTKERIRICRIAAGGSDAVSPYAGTCPPM
jgi:hypothetical protein